MDRLTPPWFSATSPLRALAPPSPKATLPEFEPTRAGDRSREKTLQFLNDLAAATRSTATAAAAIGVDAPDEDTGEALSLAAMTGARSCTIITNHVVRLAGRPRAPAAGRLQSPALTDDVYDRIRRLEHDQSALLQRLEDALPAIQDHALRRDLEQIRVAHLRITRALETVLANRS